MTDISDIFEGELVQLWKDDKGDFQLSVLCASIRIESACTKQVLQELKQAVSKSEDYFAGRSI